MDVDPATSCGVAGDGPGEEGAAPTVREQRPVPDELRALSTMTDPDYADVFTMTGMVPGRSPEQWARAMFEVVGGRQAQLLWRGLLGLRLAAAPDRVAGWVIAARGHDWIRLEAGSRLMTTHLVVHADDDSVSLATFIGYEHPLASRIWLPISTRHRRAAPGLLRQAHRAQQPGPCRPDGRCDAAGSVLDRPLVGRSLMAIAAVHTVTAPVFHPDSVRSTWDAGVIGAVERDPSLSALRGVGFWYVTAGLGTALLGAVVHWCEVHSAGVPRRFGWGLLALTAWGAALMPRSGFWAFAVPAVLALRRRPTTTPAVDR